MAFVGGAANAGLITENLSVVFTHGASINPTNNALYLTATIADTGPNAVQLTLTSNLGNQGYNLPSYYVGNFWLEYLSASNGYTASSDLNVSYVSGANATVTLHNASDQQADGANRYDINLSFATALLGNNGTAVFNITAKNGATFSAANFAQPGTLGGANSAVPGYVAAAAVFDNPTGGQINDSQTFLIGAPVPEPTSLVSWTALAALVGLCGAIRHRKSNKRLG
ncbi:MAG TPA: hypothetical protein VHD36_07315 [Pirellulales bacterium]|nr:hypothetical protein [Pirellulales bacterium]